MDTLAKQLRGQFIMLTVMFLLGMSVNLIGLPGELSAGTLKTIDGIITALHALIAIGLVVGAVRINRTISKNAPTLRTLAGGAASGIGIAFLGGIGVFALHDAASNAASFVMAAGFIGAFLAYGKLYMQTNVARK
ncbi:MAG: hypothetical protein JWN01_1189 [Patescibacteria group bacterium]|nr:hypothetical protein [Patescibacteria group bacterium]